MEKGLIFWVFRAVQPHEIPKKTTYPELTLVKKLLYLAAQR
jgi:hypothetical protein